MEVSPTEFKIGDIFLQDLVGETPIEVEVLSASGPCKDLFGRDMIRYWAKRRDTGKEGWIIYGPGAIEREVINR